MDQKRVPSYVPVFFMTFALCFSFGYAIAQLNIKEVQENWEERRCEAAILASSWLYSPKDYDGGSSQFGSDNFTYCSNKVIDASLGIAFSPVKSMFEQTVKSSDQAHSSMNALRGAASNFQKVFMDMMKPVYDRFSAITQAVSIIFVRMKFAMSRLNAVLTTAVFVGLAGLRAITNGIRFTIKVVEIIVAILIVIIFLLVLFIFPFSVLLLTTAVIVAVMAIVVDVVIAGELDHMMGFQNGSNHSKTLCVPSGTLVETADGLLPIEKLAPGDVLRGGGTVEGILQASGTCAEFVSIDGILVGKGHLVWDTEQKRWCSSEDHVRAAPSLAKTDFVYCLNTSDRTWTVRSGDVSLVLRDWEELPVDLSGTLDAEWDSRMAATLPSAVFPKQRPRPLFGPDTQILTPKGVVPLSSIQVGDLVEDVSKGVGASLMVWTVVVATIRDRSEYVKKEGPTEGCWIYSRGEWVHPAASDKVAEAAAEGFHLLTESGTFVVRSDCCAAAGFGAASAEGPTLVRDFSEIGLDTLDRLRPWILDLLNNARTELA